MTINDEVLAWLSNRPAGRPFFAFLNYYDAHDPYSEPQAAAGRPFRPHASRLPGSSRPFATGWRSSRKGPQSGGPSRLARDCYDDCIAYLDDQVGRLFSELDAKGMLENTLVVITSDHGELIGESAASSAMARVCTMR